jgi:hypothetical protein
VHRQHQALRSLAGCVGAKRPPRVEQLFVKSGFGHCISFYVKWKQARSRQPTTLRLPRQTAGPNSRLCLHLSSRTARKCIRSRGVTLVRQLKSP